MHTEEEKIELGYKELDILRRMFKAWLKSDFNWALGIITSEGTSGEEDEWDFLWRDWVEKLDTWLLPYAIRLRETEYVTEGILKDFVEELYDDMKVMLLAIKALTEGAKNEQDI
jgi:hypothetical protein